MSTLQKQIFDMIFVLPDSTLLSLKPLLNELLTAAVLANDPSANVADMDEFDKALFLRSLDKLDSEEYVSFEDALVECGVSFDDIYDNN